VFGKKAALNTPSALPFFQKGYSGLDYSKPLRDEPFHVFGRKTSGSCRGILLSDRRSHSVLDCTVPRPQLCISLVGNNSLTSIVKKRCQAASNCDILLAAGDVYEESANATTSPAGSNTDLYATL